MEEQVTANPGVCDSNPAKVHHCKWEITQLAINAMIDCNPSDGVRVIGINK